jgi:uncharacterized protein
MKSSFLQKLVCPFDKQDLQIKIIKQEHEEIIEGILTCTQCNRYYPIVHGIPIMSPDEYRELKLELPLLDRWGEKILVQEGSPSFQLATDRQLPITSDDK